ncbi:formimidoylglutamate deiminase [Maricaulis sp. CAU 1757]
MTEFYIDHVLLPDGWASSQHLVVDETGQIAGLNRVDTPPPAARRLGTVIPGLANLHSHGFQRGMAGLSERRGSGQDSFWSWRETMYAFNDHLDPDQVEAITALAYAEMLESGFTSVGEFHYLHHDRDGTPFADPAEMAGRVAAAAAHTGIALTLLPVFYRHGGFNQAEPGPRQRRFLNTPDTYAALHEAARRHIGQLDHARLGIAPHSLRAASVDDISAILPLVENPDSRDPVHIHVAEQTAEVEACIDANGRRPVRFLMEHFDIGEAWCLVHATHLDAGECSALARSGAVAGLCPLTEANLGDGLFPAAEYLAEGGRFGIGSDSHIRIDLPEELRLLEYGARLGARQRNVLALPGGHTGRHLFEGALAGGARALAQPAAGIAVGQRADLVELDTSHLVLEGRSGDTMLDSWLFCGDSRQVRRVFVGGRLRVDGGRVPDRDAIETRYRAAMHALRSEMA